MHSLQHLQDNMDLILNQTKSKTQEDHSDLTTEQIASRDRPSRSKDNIDISFITEHANIANLNKVLTTLKKRYSNVFNKSKYSNTYHVFRNSSKWRRGRENNSSGWIQKFPSGKNSKNNHSYLANELKINFTKIRRYNGTISHSKGLRNTRHNNSSKITVASKSTKCSTVAKVTFEPDMVRHIKRAHLWVQQKERKRDPEAEVVMIVKLDKKAHLKQMLAKQQQKLVSLEKFLEKNKSSIYRYVVVNNTIVNSTPKAEVTPITLRSRYTLPLCFITEPRVRGHLRRNQYTNSNSYSRYNGNYTILRRYYNHTFNNGMYFQKNWNYSNNKFSTFFRNRIKYTTTIYFNQNLYKNFNYDAHGYDNMINVKNKAITNEAGSYFTSYTSRYSRPYKRTNYRSNTSIKVTHANKNLYKNMNLSQNVNTVKWIKSHPKTGNKIVKPIYVNNKNLYRTTDNVNHTLRSPVDAIIGFHKEENHGNSSQLKRYENNKRDEDPGEHTDDEQKNINANGNLAITGTLSRYLNLHLVRESRKVGYSSYFLK